MTAPDYTTDLTVIDLADAITNWAESTDANWDDGGGPNQETEYFIHNGGTAACISAAATVMKGAHSTLIADNGSGVTVPTDGAALFWVKFAAPNALDTYANGGLKGVIGSGLGDFYYWDMGGNDFGRLPYGGWENYAIDPAHTIDGTVGTPTGTDQYFGVAHKITLALARGFPFGVDVVRYGRCEARFRYGDVTNGYCTFAGYAAVNDAVSARWGLIQKIPGGYLYKGLMTFGYTNAVDFRDSDTSILIDDVRKVTANFNKIEIRQSSSRVDWANIQFKALGTVSRCALAVIDDADVNITECQFTGMDTFTFLANSEALDSIFRGCNAITMSGAGKLNGSRVLVPTVAADTSAVVWNIATDPSGYLDDMVFSAGTNAHHAIEFGASSPRTINLVDIEFIAFNSSNGLNDSTFLVKHVGGAVAINCSGCTGNVTYKATAGATVTVTSNVNVKFDKLQDNTEVRVYKTSDDSVVGGIENATAGATGNRNYTWSAPAATDVYYHILNKQYEQVTVYGYVVPLTNITLDIAQKFDRNYSNPV